MNLHLPARHLSLKCLNIWDHFRNSPPPCFVELIILCQCFVHQVIKWYQQVPIISITALGHALCNGIRYLPTKKGAILPLFMPHNRTHEQLWKIIYLSKHRYRFQCTICKFSIRKWCRKLSLTSEVWLVLQLCNIVFMLTILMHRHSGRRNKRLSTIRNVISNSPITALFYVCNIQ